MKAFFGTDKNKIIYGVNNKEFPLSELMAVPRFLRFDSVRLEYLLGCRSQSIAQKFESFRRYLPSIKASLYDSNRIQFYYYRQFYNCQEDPSEFADHSELLEHIRQIVSICDSSRGYSFIFPSPTDIMNVIASILEMPAISRSSSVYIYHYHPYNDNITVTQLTIEKISTWLNRERRAMDQNQRERTLWLDCSVKVAQFQEMCDFLKQVFFPKIKPFSFEFAI